MAREDQVEKNMENDMGSVCVGHFVGIKAPKLPSLFRSLSVPPTSIAM